MGCLKRWSAPLILLAAGCAQAPGPSHAVYPTASPSCALSTNDRAWLDRSMAAWNYTSRNITNIGPVKNLKAVIFDDHCELTSSTAMNGGPSVWQTQLHPGQVKLPTGESIPAGMTSFASADERGNFFVMSTPSVWRANNVNPGTTGLDLLMTGVLLHEATHVAQAPTYGRRMDDLTERWKLPEDFNDDSIQKRFEGNAEFSAAINRETQLLLDAAAAPDRETSIHLAREARAMMRGRQDRWYPAADGYLREAEDIWLTMEGSAQWAAYQWLIDKRGGRLSPQVAGPGFGTRSKWWTQKQGFALFLVLERLTGDRWKKHAFGDGAKTGLEMLDEAIA